MSKHKKRVSLAQPLPATPASSVAQVAPPQSAADQLQEQKPREEVSAELSVPVTGDGQTSGPQKPGIEAQPVFWFVLGALTVGIIVLLGLLLMSTPSAQGALRSPTATAAAVRPATATPAAANPAPARAGQPDIAATVTAAVKANESVPRMSLDEARQRLDAGSILMIDVRSKEAFAEKHIKGAINIPEADTQSRLSEFPRDKDIVLYCA